MAYARKVPLRTCVACNQTRPKPELIRIVRTPNGELTVDPRGKLSGRGAYLCADLGCLNEAMKHRKIERALDVRLTPELIDRLRTMIGEA